MVLGLGLATLTSSARPRCASPACFTGETSGAINVNVPQAMAFAAYEDIEYRPRCRQTHEPLRRESEPHDRARPERSSAPGRIPLVAGACPSG